jgi:diphthamide synthase (EF-2-diphthine--ammonia ligase)
LSGEFVARDVDEEFLNDLPTRADPCGENGEFHSFVYDGPIFKKAIPFRKGDIVVKRGRFHYCDLLPL